MLPIIKKIAPFDATKPYQIEIAWTGNRAKSSRVVIRRYDTPDVVYDAVE